MAGSNGQLNSAQATVNISVDTNPPAASICAYVSGTFVGTLTFEASVDANSTQGAANWFSIGAVPINAQGLPYGAQVTTATAGGQWTIPNNGFAQVRVRCSAYTSGTAYVALDGSGASSQVLVMLGDSFSVGGLVVAPSAGTTIATVTPGVAGTFEITVNTAMSQGTPVAVDGLNMALYYTTTPTLIAKLAQPGAPVSAGPFGPFRQTIGSSDPISVRAVATATTSVGYFATITCKRVA